MGVRLQGKCKERGETYLDMLAKKRNRFLGGKICKHVHYYAEVSWQGLRYTMVDSLVFLASQPSEIKQEIHTWVFFPFARMNDASVGPGIPIPLFRTNLSIFADPSVSNSSPYAGSRLVRLS